MERFGRFEERRCGFRGWEKLSVTANQCQWPTEGLQIQISSEISVYSCEVFFKGSHQIGMGKFYF